MATSELAQAPGNIRKETTYPSQGSGLVRANDRHSSQGLNSFQGLAKNHVLPHQICSDSQTRSQSNWETFWNESDCNADAVDDQGRHVDPVRMIFSQPCSPSRR